MNLPLAGGPAFGAACEHNRPIFDRLATLDVEPPKFVGALRRLAGGMPVTDEAGVVAFDCCFAAEFSVAFSFLFSSLIFS